MSFPGIIERPLYGDEFSIYLDNTVPIPLSALATFLGKIDKAARSTRGMDGLLLELSDFALGSNELRFRIVEKRRPRREEDRQERAVAAAEKSAKATVVGAGATVVSSVVAVVTIAMMSGDANPSTCRITNEYNVNNIYVRAPDEQPHVLTRRDVQHGRKLRLSKERAKLSPQLEAENEVLMMAMDRHEVVKLAGRFYRLPNGNYDFRTMIGNRYPVHFRSAREYEHSPVALAARVHPAEDGLHLEVVDIITELSDL